MRAHRLSQLQNLSVLDRTIHRDVYEITPDDWDDIRARWHHREQEDYGITLPCCDAPAVPVYGPERQRFFRHPQNSQCDVVLQKGAEWFDVRRHFDLVGLLQPHKPPGCLMDHFHHLNDGGRRRSAAYLPYHQVTIMSAASKATPEHLNEVDEQLAAIGVRVIWVFNLTPSAALCEFIVRHPERCFVVNGEAARGFAYRPIPYEGRGGERYFKTYFERHQMQVLSEVPGAFLFQVAQRRIAPRQLSLTKDYVLTSSRACRCGRELQLPDTVVALHPTEEVMSLSVPLFSRVSVTRLPPDAQAYLNGLFDIDERFSTMVRAHNGGVRFRCLCGEVHLPPRFTDAVSLTVEIPSAVTTDLVTWEAVPGLLPEPNLQVASLQSKPLEVLPRPAAAPPAADPRHDRLRRLLQGPPATRASVPEASMAPVAPPNFPDPVPAVTIDAAAFEMAEAEKTWSRQQHEARLQKVRETMDLYLPKRQGLGETVERMKRHRRAAIQSKSLEAHEPLLNVALAETMLWPDDPERGAFCNKFYRLECEALVLKRRLLIDRACAPSTMEQFYEDRERLILPSLPEDQTDTGAGR